MPMKEDANKLFYMPDSFDRDSVLTYCTAAKGGDISGTTVTTAATNDCFTIADYADTASLGYTSGMINVKTTADDFQDQIDSLREAVEKLKDSLVCVPQTKNRMSKLRSELKTLRGAL